jgi:hypothetical protein
MRVFCLIVRALLAANAALRRQLEEVLGQLRDTEAMLQEVMRYKAEPIPCRGCGSRDGPICPGCHEPRA